MRKLTFKIAVGAAIVVGFSGMARANGLIVSPNGTAQIGVNDDGSLDANTSAGFVGIGYNFTGQGGRTGFNDALTPGCPCEAWGIAANGVGGQVGPQTGNQNIGVNLSSAGTSNNSSAGPTSTFTSNTFLSQPGMTGLTVSQTFSLGAQTPTGALFQDSIVIHNGTGGAISNVQFARAMDWDVPPTEFSEFVRIGGTGTTPTLLRSTDNGFANANPLTAISDAGIIGPINSDGTTGPADHGSLFVFGFGSLLDGQDKHFNIFYGAGANESDALGLLSLISPELFSLGMSTGADGSAATGLPTFVFAFNGVGGSVVVPPVPEPSTWIMMILGFAGVSLMAYRRRKSLTIAA